MRTIPPEVVKALPENAADERDWMAALLVTLPHLCPVALRRQNAGGMKTRDGAFVKLGQAGVADITGEARGGLRIELEAKMPQGKLSVAQQRWQDHCRLWGTLHAVCRYDDTRTLLECCTTAAYALNALLELRGVDVE